MTVTTQTTRALRKTAKLAPRPLARATLPGEVYRQIKNFILDGSIAPGELVTIQGLASTFGVSTMPVREALQRLTAEKALTVIAGRSVGIPHLDTLRLQDLCRVRLEIEGMAARWAAVRITAEDLEKLEALYNEMNAAIERRDPHAFVRANHDFHFVIYRAADSDALSDIIEGLWLQVSPYFHLLHGSDNYVTSNERHRLILTALRSRDAEAAARGIQADITAAAEMLMRLLD